jgi:hypothetical protein
MRSNNDKVNVKMVSHCDDLVESVSHTQIRFDLDPLPPNLVLDYSEILFRFCFRHLDPRLDLSSALGLSFKAFPTSAAMFSWRSDGKNT